MGAYCSDKRGVVLYHRWKAHSKLGLAEPQSLKHHVRLLTPGDKEAIVFHTSHYFINLLH